VADLLRRALAAVPAWARAGGRVALSADAGYFAGQLARVGHDERIACAIGAKRIAQLAAAERHSPKTGMMRSRWTARRSLPPVAARTGDLRPLLIRRVRPDPAQVSAYPQARPLRTCTRTSGHCHSPGWPGLTRSKASS